MQAADGAWSLAANLSPPITVEGLAQCLSEFDAESVRQLNALIKPLRIVRDKPRPSTKSLLVEATAVEQAEDQGTGHDTAESPQEDRASGCEEATSASVHASTNADTSRGNATPASSGEAYDTAPREGEARKDEAKSTSSTPTSRRPSSLKRKRPQPDTTDSLKPRPTARKKPKDLSTTNLLTKANRERRQKETETVLREGCTSPGTPAEEAEGASILAKWSQNLPNLASSWDSLLSSYPSNWDTEQRLVAVDEALFKASLLHPRLPLRNFSQGLQLWVAQWIEAAQRPHAPQVPQHLRGKKDFQEFWALDQDVQMYQNNHIVTSALLRLAKVRLAEKYEEMKEGMRLPGVRRKRGQTAAAKAKETIFETTFLDPEEREAAKRRFTEAQYTSSVLLDLCREHSYGILVTIPPSITERDFRSTAVEFAGFQAALRILLGSAWIDTLRVCGDALVSVSKGQKPEQHTLDKLSQFKDACSDELESPR